MADIAQYTMNTSGSCDHSVFLIQNQDVIITLDIEKLKATSTLTRHYNELWWTTHWNTLQWRKLWSQI